MAASEPVDRALDAVAAALLKEKRVLVTTHMKPDGDALGCMIAIHRAMEQAGADSVMYMAGDSAIAPEFKFLRTLDEARTGEAPEDVSERTMIAVDCGNAERIGNDELVAAVPHIINVDHHGDNSRFGEVNLVIAGASSTAEIIYFIFQKMGIEITPEIAEALYTGILMDSGRFQYASTSPATLRVAADLIARGIDHTEIFRHLYESVPLTKARLACRMMDNLTLACDGRLAIGVLKSSDFEAAGAGVELTDGLVNNLRELEGIQVAALIYQRPPNGESAESYFRVSLRSSSERMSMQRIAKEKGGGGHKQAAGFSAGNESVEELIGFLTERVGAALDAL